MNIITFDTEEWYLKEFRNIFQDDDFKTYDHYLNRILDLLDGQNTKATFFCLGGLARNFPDVVKSISCRGHEIGCHSDEHIWLSKLTPDELKKDTEKAIQSLEDVIGRKVVSYRAPAFSISEQNKWALEVLAECGIERDASIYPAVRDFGGFDNFPSNEPCLIKVGDFVLKEFPITLTSLIGKQVAYSGGGYFRFFPLPFIRGIINNSEYVMTYFHITDLLHRPLQLWDKKRFEDYYKQPATLKNRTIRMLKNNYGTKGAFDKMCRLVGLFDFINLEEADKIINWKESKTFVL